MTGGPVMHFAATAITDGDLDEVPCCGRHPSTLPLGDSTTVRLDMVTCPGPDGEPDETPGPMSDERLEEIRWHWYEAGNVVPAVYELLAEVDYQRAERDRLRSACDQYRSQIDRLQDTVQASQADTDERAEVKRLRAQPPHQPCLRCGETDWTCFNCGRADV